MCPPPLQYRVTNVDPQSQFSFSAVPVFQYEYDILMRLNYLQVKSRGLPSVKYERCWIFCSQNYKFKSQEGTLVVKFKGLYWLVQNGETFLSVEKNDKLKQNFLIYLIKDFKGYKTTDHKM